VGSEEAGWAIAARVAAGEANPSVVDDELAASFGRTRR
jgi:hypothetical protein